MTWPSDIRYDDLKDLPPELLAQLRLGATERRIAKRKVEPIRAAKEFWETFVLNEINRTPPASTVWFYLKEAKKLNLVARA